MFRGQKLVKADDHVKVIENFILLLLADTHDRFKNPLYFANTLLDIVLNLCSLQVFKDGILWDARHIFHLGCVNIEVDVKSQVTTEGGKDAFLAV